MQLEANENGVIVIPFSLLEYIYIPIQKDTKTIADWTYFL